MVKSPRDSPGFSLLSAALLFLIMLSAGCAGLLPSLPVTGPSSLPDNTSWKEFSLSDIQGKGNFSVNTFAGRPVLVPVVSAACPSCIILLGRQLNEIDRLPGVRDGKIVVVYLDLDPAGEPGFIASYADQFNFSGYSAHAPTDLTRKILHTFGPFSIDSNAVPVILVCPDGHDLLLPAGVKTAEVLNTSLQKEC